jgi:hypothetical protein
MEETFSLPEGRGIHLTKFFREHMLDRDLTLLPLTDNSTQPATSLLVGLLNCRHWSMTTGPQGNRGNMPMVFIVDHMCRLTQYEGARILDIVMHVLSAIFSGSIDEGTMASHLDTKAALDVSSSTKQL